MSTTKLIGIFNNKGGVAKTTTVINLAYCLHKQDKKVLVVDCDTQENCFDFFFSEMSTAIFRTRFENIMLVKYSSFKTLDEFITNSFDYIIFDLPPILTDEVTEIISLSDKVFVPMMLGRFEIKGLKNLTTKCGNKLGGVFITMYKNRDAELLEQVKNALGNRLLKTVIPYSDTIRDSQKYGLTLEEYFEKKGVSHNLKNAYKSVDAYTALTNEIVGGLQ